MTHAGRTTIDDDQQPSMAVINLVSQVAGVDPINLDPLYDAIDPDVLDSLCESSTGFNHLEFTYLGYSITVESTGDDTVISLEHVDGVVLGTDGGADELPDTEFST